MFRILSLTTWPAGYTPIGIPPKHLSPTVHQHPVVTTTRTCLIIHSHSHSLTTAQQSLYQQQCPAWYVLLSAPRGLHSSRRPPYALRPQLVRQRPPGAHHNHLTLGRSASPPSPHSNLSEPLRTH
ncbi:hypothetical protein IG631_18637 [Alternaria alternata]|nr:hypothetical protein IG631_18637 [Alternaria alternata]